MHHHHAFSCRREEIVVEEYFQPYGPTRILAGPFNIPTILATSTFNGGVVSVRDDGAVVLLESGERGHREIGKVNSSRFCAGICTDDHGFAYLGLSKLFTAVSSSGHKYVAIYAHERFISLIRIDEERGAVGSGPDHGQIVKYDTAGIILNCLMLTDGEGLVYLITFHCGSMGDRRGTAVLLCIETGKSTTLQLPTAFLYPSQCVKVSQDQIIVFSSQAMLVIRVDFEALTISADREKNIFRICQEGGSGKDLCHQAQGGGLVTEASPIFLVESVSNAFITSGEQSLTCTHDESSFGGTQAKGDSGPPLADCGKTGIFFASTNKGHLMVFSFVIAPGIECPLRRGFAKVTGRIIVIEDGGGVGSAPCSSLVALQANMVVAQSIACGICLYAISLDRSSAKCVRRFGEKTLMYDIACAVTRRKVEILVAAGVGDCAAVSIFKDDIPLEIVMRSDQVFRGCTGMWMLREYKSDAHYSMLAVSFVHRTVLFKLPGRVQAGSGGGDGITSPPTGGASIAGQNSIENISQSYGVDENRRTLAIGNAHGGSYFIQVCPDRIVMCKSMCSEIEGLPVAEWIMNGDDQAGSGDNFKGGMFSSAVIFADIVVAMDMMAGFMCIFRCRTDRRSPEIVLVSTFKVPRGSSCFATHASRNESSPQQEVAGSGLYSARLPPRASARGILFIIAVAAQEGCGGASVSFWNVYMDDGNTRVAAAEDCRVSLESFDGRKTHWVNQMLFLPSSAYGLRLFVGLRSGSIAIFSIGAESGSTNPEAMQRNVPDEPSAPREAPADLMDPTNYGRVISVDPLEMIDVGCRPVQLYRFRDVASSGVAGDKTIFAIAGPASVLVEKPMGVFIARRMLQRADHMALWSQTAGGISTFLAIERESLLMLTTCLRPLPRTHVLFPICNVRRLLVNDGLLYAISSPTRAEVDAAEVRGGSSGMHTVALGRTSRLLQQSPSDAAVVSSGVLAPIIDVYSLLDEEIVSRIILSRGDVITCGIVVGGSDLLAIGLDTQSVGQVRFYKMPLIGETIVSPPQGGGVGAGAHARSVQSLSSTPPAGHASSGGRRRQQSFTWQSTRASVPQPVLVNDVGLPHAITAMVSIGRREAAPSEGEAGGSIGDGDHRLWIAAGKELHALFVSPKDGSIRVFHMETWSVKISALASNASNNLLAICTQRGGVTIVAVGEMDDRMFCDGSSFGRDRQTVLSSGGDLHDWQSTFVPGRRTWTSPSPDPIDRIVWCGETILAGTDRRGFIHIFTFTRGGSFVKRRSIPTETIPVAISILPIADGGDGGAGDFDGFTAGGGVVESGKAGGDNLHIGHASIVYTTIIGSIHRIDLDTSFT